MRASSLIGAAHEADESLLDLRTRLSVSGKRQPLTVDHCAADRIGNAGFAKLDGDIPADVLGNAVVLHRASSSRLPVGGR